MRAVRRWSVRHARGLQRLYRAFEHVIKLLRPIVRWIGEHRLRRPAAFVERNFKGFLFDCQMCGQCALGHTGMACPMNCPKDIRNGPCGGVRPDGTCEVEPDMRCVWVEAWEGARRMAEPDDILEIQRPVDHGYVGESSWLRVVREGRAGSAWIDRPGAPETAKAPRKSEGKA